MILDLIGMGIKDAKIKINEAGLIVLGVWESSCSSSLGRSEEVQLKMFPDLINIGIEDAGVNDWSVSACSWSLRKFP